MNSKAPIFIFLATFFTFLLVFGALIISAKPELREKLNLEDIHARVMALLPGEEGNEVAEEESMEPKTASLGSSPAVPRVDKESSEESRESDPLPPIARFSGTLRGINRTPLSGGRVAVIRAHKEEGAKHFEILAEDTTRRDGSFEVELPEMQGQVRVMALADGYQRWQGPRIAIRRGKHHNLGFVQLSKGRMFPVSVQDQDGNPVTDARVTVRDLGEDFAESMCRPDFHGETGEDGVARLLGADFGHHDVLVEKAGYASWEGRVTLEDNNREVAMVNAVLAEANSFLVGTVIDTFGKPVVNAQVTAIPSDRQGSTGDRTTGTVDPAGEFRLGPVPRGSYRLELTSPGMVQRGLATGEAGSRPVQVVAEFAGAISGRLQADSFLQDAEVTLLRRDDRGRLLPFAGVRGRVDGSSLTYQAEGVPPGRYQVRITASGYAPARSQEVVIGPGENLDDVSLTMTAGGSVGGTVVDSRGTVLSDIRVTAFEGEAAPPPALAGLFTGTSRMVVSTNDQGEFQLHTLSPGLQVLVFDGPGRPARTMGPIEVRNDTDLRLGQMIMGGGGSISGTSRDATGETLASARVLLRTPDDSLWMVLVTDSGGNFSIRGLPQGQYVMQLVDPAADNQSLESIGDSVTVGLASGEHARQDVAARTE